MLSSLIQKRLRDEVQAKLAEYQYGFIKGKSTVNTILLYTSKQIEHQTEVEMLFIDFIRAFDKINRIQPIITIEDLQVKPKL